MNRIESILTGPAACLYPPRCPVCGQILYPADQRICPECRKKLPVIDGPRCARCSKPVEKEEEEYCYDCARRTFLCEKGFALWKYDRVTAESVAAFKFRGRREYVIFYAQEAVRLAESFLRRNRPDYLVPVPLHKKRLAARGYNQAALLAERIEKLTGIPYVPLLIRTRNTKPQKELNDKGRGRNVEDAFALSKGEWRRLPGIPDTVLLVDDIYTTGSTVEACAAALREAGVRHVLFLTLCIGRGF